VKKPPEPKGVWQPTGTLLSVSLCACQLVIAILQCNIIVGPLALPVP